MEAKAKDPVCGMMVDPDRAPAQMEYRGTTYYFCAPGCRRAFEQDPDRYLSQEATDAHSHAGHCCHGQ